MAAYFSINASQSGQVGRAFQLLADRAKPAIARALNRAAVSARTVMQRKVAADVNLPVDVVRDAIRIENATSNQLRARIIITGKPFPLEKFGARQTRRGVTANTGGGRKLYPHTFLARMGSGHIGVFQRSGKARLPIHEKFGPSLPHVFAKHAPEGQAAGEASLQKNLAHEISYALQQLAT